MIISGHIKPKAIRQDLYNLAKLGDMVRHAQKKKKRIIITPKGEVMMEEWKE